MNNNTYFQECDALLLSVISRYSGRNIYKILTTIDFYYRILPSFSELSGAMIRLQESGLVINKKTGIFCTDKSKKLFRGTSGMGMTSLMINLTERLPEFQFYEKCEVTFFIDEEEYSCAIRDIKRGMNKA